MPSFDRMPCQPHALPQLGRLWSTIDQNHPSCTPQTGLSGLSGLSGLTSRSGLEAKVFGLSGEFKPGLFLTCHDLLGRLQLSP